MKIPLKNWLGCLSALTVITLSTGCGNTDTLNPTSPNGLISLTDTGQTDGDFGFDVTYGDSTDVIAITRIGLLTAAGHGSQLRLTGVDTPRHLVERYTMPTGKRRDCSNEANEYLYHFRDSLDQEVLMRMRLYNDGIAFRYELPAAGGDSLIDELTTFRIDEGTRRWMQSYIVGYEGFYPKSESGHATDSREWSYPALIELNDTVWALISEADITRSQSGSRLTNDTAPTDYRVRPFENAAPLEEGWYTPWRVLIIGSLADVVESTLITDTSTPSVLPDTIAIKPGSAAWIYWAYNHGSKDYQLVKDYIDMAEELGFPYVLIDWEWDQMGNGGTIEDAVGYALSKGIRPLLWYNSSTLWTDEAAGPLFRLNSKEDREREFAWLKSIGVAGVKIDFFTDDTESTMTYYQDLLKTAADCGLLVNFHGATIPRGWQRTYPNLMTAEAVYGAEWYNNKGTLTREAPAHNATLPFTRNVIGSMDYTPCTFSDSQHPHLTTHAHELALPVVFESGLQHWADRPASYLAQPSEVKALMGSLPTAWDDTRLAGGYPGEYAVMARRSGDRWYVGAINGTDTARTIPVSWHFLPDTIHTVTLFEDSGDSDSPWEITTRRVRTSDLPAEIPTLPRGGFVAVIE